MRLIDTKTYCNPLPIPDCPRGTDGWGTMKYTGEPETDYRSVSDPSVLYEDGKWYLYPSYGMAWVSEDFCTWKHVRTTPYDMKYSPTVVRFRGEYLMTSHSNGLYRSDSPLGDFEYLGDFIRPDGTGFRPIDPALFVDDDGRLYMYFFGVRDSTHKSAFITGTYGVELDGNDPRRMLTDPVCLFEFNGEHEWERFGEHRQDTLCGWIEGQWMLKKNGRYYLIYAAAGTEHSTYCMAAYYSDTGALSGFRPQKHNPITESRHGLIRGAGHGCVVEGPNDTLWAFYTVTLAYTHLYERRIGMDLIAVNDDGELYAPHGVTDTPQLAPGISDDPVRKNGTDLLPLTARQRAMCRSSGHSEGHEAFFALDENMLTFWQPKADDEQPWLTVCLQAPYVVQAARLIWRETNLDYEKGITPAPIRYVLEGRSDAGKGEWVMLLDASQNDRDLNCDYRVFAPRSCEEIRLRILGADHGIKPGLIHLTVFGQRDETV